MNSSDLRIQTGYRQILGLALPISLAMLVPQINFITNNIFLRRIGGASTRCCCYYRRILSHLRSNWQWTQQRLTSTHRPKGRRKFTQRDWQTILPWGVGSTGDCTYGNCGHLYTGTYHFACHHSQHDHCRTSHRLHSHSHLGHPVFVFVCHAQRVARWHQSNQVFDLGHTQRRHSQISF